MRHSASEALGNEASDMAISMYEGVPMPFHDGNVREMVFSR